MAEIAGINLIVPTSVSGSGTISLSPSGKITFSGSSSISINGIFDNTYDNYLIIMQYIPTSANPNVYMRMRSFGSDATGSNYTHQTIISDGSTVNANRSSNVNYGFIGGATTSIYNALSLTVYGPALTKTTSWRSTTIRSTSGSRLQDHGCVHSLTNSYDGATIYPSSDSISGNISIYGLAK